MADHSQSMSYNAGEAKGHAEVKKDQMVDKASGAMQSAKESCQQVIQLTHWLSILVLLMPGQQMKEKAQGAADTVKEATE
ncbi:hypothetical protein MKX03_033294 [Papaver bracteatum]|nr:hypothetical protein MKX03_033294 [Papaver bracteatum]